jgi:hypothetical protein
MVIPNRKSCNFLTRRHCIAPSGSFAKCNKLIKCKENDSNNNNNNNSNTNNNNNIKKKKKKKKKKRKQVRLNIKAVAPDYFVCSTKAKSFVGLSFLSRY